MSALRDSRFGGDPPFYGADQVRESEEETPSFVGTGRARRGLAAPDWTKIVEGTRFAGDVAIQQLREGRSLDPDPTQAVTRRRRKPFAMFARLAVTIIIAAAAAFVLVQLVPSWRMSRDQIVAGSAPQSAPANLTAGAQLAAVEPSKPVAGSVPKATESSAPRAPKPILRAADEPNQTTVGEAVPLGLNVEGSTEGVVAIVTGLLPGSNLSVGNAVSPTAWHLPARDLARVLVRPPSGFSGTMEVVVDLQVAGDQIVDRRWRRLEWTGTRAVRTTTEPAAAIPPAAPAPSASTAPRTLEPEEIAVLLRRGEQLIEAGDLPSARLLLRRAAEARDARAAFALAGTYDPLVLSKLGAYGFAPDLATARHWYQKAAEFGSREAAARLDMLASTGSR